MNGLEASYAMQIVCQATQEVRTKSFSSKFYYNLIRVTIYAVIP